MDEIVKLLRKGLALVAYLDEDGDLHVGYIERHPLVAAKTEQDAGDPRWDQVFVSVAARGEQIEQMLPILVVKATEIAMETLLRETN